MKNARRKAVNLIFKFYEFDAAMMAAAMEAEMAEDNSALVEILEKTIAELRNLADALKPPVPQSADKTSGNANPKKPRGRQPNPDRELQKRLNGIAKRRSQLREDGYHIERNSMIAYYDNHTRRRIKAEQSNKFGFIFKPISKK